MNEIIRRDFFPYQSALRQQNLSLNKLIHSAAIVSPDKIAHLLAETPRRTPKIDNDPHTAPPGPAPDPTDPGFGREKGRSKKADIGLADFARSHVSHNEASFQKILAADTDRHSEKHWWVSDLNRPQPAGFARPRSRAVRLLSEEGKEQIGLVGPKNGLMFYPDAAPLRSAASARAETAAKRELRTANTRFAETEQSAFARNGAFGHVGKIDGKGDGKSAEMEPSLGTEEAPEKYAFVRNTPAVEPSDGNVSPLVTWGSLGSTPVRLRDEGRENTYRILEPSRREKAHRSLVKRMAGRQRAAERSAASAEKARATPRAGRRQTPGSCERVDLGCLSVDRDLRRSYASPAPAESHAKRRG